MDELSTIMNKAIDLQKHGKLEEAVSIYLKILDIQPSNAAAMHLLGLVFHSQGKFKDAVECIGKAIIQSPDIADFHSNMAAYTQSRMSFYYLIYYDSWYPLKYMC